MKFSGVFRYFIYFLGLYVLVHVFVYLFQKQIIFQEKRLYANHRFQFSGEFEELFLYVKPGERINALYFKTALPRLGTILYFHGNADHLQRWGKYASDFTSRGYDILMIDYRGYGKSDGKPSETNLATDAEVAYQWLREKVPAEEIVIYGRSLGTGVATGLGAKHPARMMILETPFYSIQSVIQTRYPFLWLAFPLQQQFRSDLNVPQMSYPVHIFQGTKDRVVPHRNALRLQELLKPGDQFFTIPEGQHKNLNTFPAYHTGLDQLLLR